MLVLSRKKNESIVIDENVVITIVEIRGDKVRLGIEAPREVPVHRGELRFRVSPPKSDSALPVEPVPRESRLGQSEEFSEQPSELSGLTEELSGEIATAPESSTGEGHSAA